MILFLEQPVQFLFDLIVEGKGTVLCTEIADQSCLVVLDGADIVIVFLAVRMTVFNGVNLVLQICLQLCIVKVGFFDLDIVCRPGGSRDTSERFCHGNGTGLK